MFGTARKFINSLLVVIANPDRMIDRLAKYYGGHQRILSNLARDLRYCDGPRYKPKHELLDFALQLDALIVTAKALDESVYLDQPLLTDIVVEKLKDEHQDWWWNYRKHNPRASFPDLAAYLLERATDPSASPPTMMYSTEQNMFRLPRIAYLTRL